MLAYNIAWLAAPPRVRHLADHLAVWLLLCAGVGERFHVMFFTPTCLPCTFPDLALGYYYLLATSGSHVDSIIPLRRGRALCSRVG